MLSVYIRVYTYEYMLSARINVVSYKPTNISAKESVCVGHFSREEFISDSSHIVRIFIDPFGL